MNLTPLAGGMPTGTCATIAALPHCLKKRGPVPIPIFARLAASRFLLLRRIIIGVLAGLLIFYHVTVLYDLYLGVGNHEGLYDRTANGTPKSYEYIQSALRLIIIIGLALVVCGFRRALWVMWAGIGLLVATHYWAHFGDIPVAFAVGRHPLSYLKGFIFPTVITLLTLLPSRPSGASPRTGSGERGQVDLRNR